MQTYVKTKYLGIVLDWHTRFSVIFSLNLEKIKCLGGLFSGGEIAAVVKKN